MSKQTCFVCGESYETEELPSVKVKLGKEKATVKSLRLEDKNIPLCHKCLKAVLLSTTLTKFYTCSINLDFEDLESC